MAGLPHPCRSVHAFQLQLTCQSVLCDHLPSQTALAEHELSLLLACCHRYYVLEPVSASCAGLRVIQVQACSLEVYAREAAWLWCCPWMLSFKVFRLDDVPRLQRI